jgi:hypothetical protein
MTMLTAPDRSEFADYYWTYVSKVGPGDIREILEAQAREIVDALKSIPEAYGSHAYAPGKWTIKQVISHVNDTERVFASRALWFARGFDSPLPSFDQEVAIAHAAADSRSLAEHAGEFHTIRAATLSLFKGFAGDAWMRRGTASGNPFTVRALAYITAGHAAHHLSILQERYFQAAQGLE